ncbi:COMM domain-containing protein 6-like [Actinia tenebrosa]|uniref:COMM domain-containing protein 6 n=1 Tax=Actinia tenebrosa TaxID=6105 RepID=A0A6P8HQM6_ACTTE|nr:COMM domain-containing protein 6-like [Actinia tenebrosa]
MKMAEKILTNIPQGFNAAVEKIKIIPQDIFAEICQDVADFLQYKLSVIDTEQHQKRLNQAGIDCDAKLVSNVITYIFRSSAKAKATPNQLIEELSAAMIWEESSLAVIKHIWNEQGNFLCSPDLVKTLNVGQLVDMRWKLSIGMSSSICRNLNAPYITLLITVSDSSGNLKSKSCELTVSEFKKFSSLMREMSSMLETV